MRFVRFSKHIGSRMGAMWLNLITTSVLLSCAFAECNLTDDSPQIEIFPLEQTVRSGSTTLFGCTVTGNSKLEIKWRWHGEHKHYHPLNGSFYVSPRASYEHIPKYEKIDMTNGSALKINSAAPGTLECFVQNGTEELVRATAQLKTIDTPPKIEIFSQNQTVKPGGIAVFVCTATGSPNLQIKWIRNNGSEEHDRSRYKDLYGSRNNDFGKIPIFETINMTNGSVLRIHVLGPETFDCVAGNGADEPVRATAYLDTPHKYKTPDGFPLIAPQNSDVQRVSKGHRILLPCLATGDPKPTIRWLRNKLPLNMSVPRYSLFEEQFLQISDAKEEDEGKYECIANNSAGSALSTKIELLVSERLHSPYFTVKPDEIYRPMPEDSLNITCLANGSPQPSVKWIKDSTVISPNRNGLNVLELTDIQGSHNYTCVASSEMGDVEATTQVITISYPIAPTNLRVSGVTATCIHLSWSYDIPTDNIYLYEIRYKASDASDFSYENILPYYRSKQNESHTFCGLRPGTEYEFYVTANNELGEGPKSSSVFATTKRR